MALFHSQTRRHMITTINSKQLSVLLILILIEDKLMLLYFILSREEK